MFADIGFADAKTLLATGNVVFTATGSDAELASKLREETKKRFGLETDYMVRTSDEIAAVLKNNPFPQEALDDPGHLVVLFASGEAVDGGESKLREAILGREYFRCGSRDFYFVYPDGIGTSKLTVKMIERHLGVRVTGRNWNTVQKIHAALT